MGQPPLLAMDRPRLLVMDKHSLCMEWLPLQDKPVLSNTWAGSPRAQARNAIESLDVLAHVRHFVGDEGMPLPSNTIGLFGVTTWVP